MSPQSSIVTKDTWRELLQPALRVVDNLRVNGYGDLRADSFKARDVFDMSAALAWDPQAANAALQATRSSRPLLLARLDAMAADSDADLMDGIMVTPSGRGFATGMMDKLAASDRGDRR